MITTSRNHRTAEKNPRLNASLQQFLDPVPIPNGVYLFLSAILDSPWSYPLHFHNEETEALCVSAGAAGSLTIDGIVYPVNGPAFFWIPAGAMHCIGYSRCPRVRQTAVLIRQPWLHDALGAFSYCKEERLREDTSKVFVAHNEEAERLGTVLSRLSESTEPRDTKPGANGLIGTIEDARILLEILVAVAGGESTHRFSRQASVPVRKAMQFIQAQFSENLSLKQIADASCVSYTHLCRLFKRYAGTGVWHYVNLVRIERAKGLLANNGKNVSEAAYECGFCDPSHFSKLFLRIVGMSPKKWQRRQR